MICRKANKNDAKRIVEININEWKNTYNKIFPSEVFKKLDNKQEESVEKCIKKIEEYIVCEENNTIIGFLRYGPNKKQYNEQYGEVYALYIDKNYQKKGYGEKMICYAFNIMKKKYKYVLISTLENNSANEFYKKINGKFIGKSKFELYNNTYIENIYLYELQS